MNKRRTFGLCLDIVKAQETMEEEMRIQEKIGYSL